MLQQIPWLSWPNGTVPQHNTGRLKQQVVDAAFSVFVQKFNQGRELQQRYLEVLESLDRLEDQIA